MIPILTANFVYEEKTLQGFWVEAAINSSTQLNQDDP